MSGLDKLGDFIESVRENLVNRKVLDSMAAEAKRLLLDRTAAGKDIQGAPFKPYSKPYRKAREKRGLSATRVDLKRTGEMLGDIYAGSHPERGLSTVSFKDAGSAQKASFHNEAKGGREFFGLGEKEREAVASIIEDHIDEVINNAS